VFSFCFLKPQHCTARNTTSATVVAFPFLSFFCRWVQRLYEGHVCCGPPSNLLKPKAGFRDITSVEKKKKRRAPGHRSKKKGGEYMREKRQRRKKGGGNVRVSPLISRGMRVGHFESPPFCFVCFLLLVLAFVVVVHVRKPIGGTRRA
jgi:hypothetical protein